MSWPRLRTVIFIRVHPVLGAMGLSGLELWEAEPTVWSSIFLNVPSATALRSEGEAESASVLAWRSVTSTSAPGRWLLRPVSLTPSGWSRPAPRYVEGGQDQGRPGGSREPFEQRFPGHPSAGRAVKWTNWLEWTLSWSPGPSSPTFSPVPSLLHYPLSIY